MQRREALRLIGGVSVFSVLSTDWLAETLRAQVAQKDPGSLQTLTSSQNEIVVAMSELILPATDTPGAKAAKVRKRHWPPLGHPRRYFGVGYVQSQ